MATGGGYETDDSNSGTADRSTSDFRSNAEIDIIKSVRVVSYRIPTFTVFTVELKHVVSW